MKRINQTVAALLVCVLLFPCYVYSAPGDKVTSMAKGDRAPFSGLLMNDQLAARVEAEKNTKLTEIQCKIKTESAVLVSESSAKKILDIQAARYLALQEKTVQVLHVKEDQIEFLRKNYLPKKWYETAPFLIASGIITGIGLTIGAAHIVKTVR